MAGSDEGLIGDSPAGNNPEPALALDAVGLEVVVIDGEDRHQLLSPRKVDERGVGKIHGPV